MPRSLTAATALVLEALGRGYEHGFDILDATGLPSGTVYPILRRLERMGCARSRWEAASQAHSEQRPPRRLYSLSAPGRELLAEARQRFSIHTGASPRATLRRA
jgi:DNA-binding PadR family transcriptional regulator